MKYQRFEELPVWQTAIDLGVRVYEMTATPEFKNRYSLRDQIERASVSVSNNIAEGFERGTNQELLTFLYISRGSVGEVRSMLCLLEKMPLFRNLESGIRNLKAQTESISKQLGAWIRSLRDSELKGQRYVTEKVRQRAATKRDREEFLEQLRSFPTTPSPDAAPRSQNGPQANPAKKSADAVMPSQAPGFSFSRQLRYHEYMTSGTKCPTIELTHLDNLWFQVTGTLCNIACAHCFNSSGPEAQEALKGPEGKRFGFLTLDRVREELAAAVALGVREVFFTGGEPFLHPRLADMLRLALESAPTTVLTNGTLITERMADRLAEIERGSRYSLEIRVSLDGYTAEMNDAIRGPGVFRQAIGAIARLSGRGLLPLVTVVRTWADDQERAALEGFVRTLREAGCARPRIKVLPALPLGRELERNGGAADDALLTEEMMAGFDRDLLMCSNSRLVTDRGVWVCPLLVEMPDARLGARLGEALPAYELRHHACVACYRYGTICGNVSADIEGPGAPPPPAPTLT